jgi:glutamyl-tRNA reductase
MVNTCAILALANERESTMNTGDLLLSSHSDRKVVRHSSVEQALQGSLSNQFDIAIPTTFAPENIVTLYHGDCMEFLQTIPNESVQLVVTSPPYNIGKEYEEVLDIEVYNSRFAYFSQTYRD